MRKGTLLGIVIVAACVLAIGAWFAVEEMLRARAAAGLPEVPGLESRPDALVRHILEADEAARGDPTNVETVAALAKAYHADGFPAEAIRCYEIASELARDDWRHTYGRALILAEHGQARAAALAFEETLAIREDLPLTWLALGDARFKLAEYDAAESAYEKAKAVGEEHPTVGVGGRNRFAVPAYASLGLARIADIRGKGEVVVDRLAWVVQRNLPFGPAHRLLATTYAKLGREKMAEIHRLTAARCQRFVPPADPFIDELARSSASTAFLLKQCALAQLAECPEWAELLAVRAYDVDPRESAGLIMLCELFDKQGRTNQGLRLLVDHRKRFPGDDSICEHLGICLDRTREEFENAGRIDDAEKLLRMAMADCPNDAFIHAMLADLLVRMDRKREAIEELRTALGMRESNEVRASLGAVLAMTGDTEAAIPEFRTVLARDPDNVGILGNLATALIESKDLRGADEITSRFLRLAADNPYAHLLRARLLVGKKLPDEARVHLKKALELDPRFEPARRTLEDMDRDESKDG